SRRRHGTAGSSAGPVACAPCVRPRTSQVLRVDRSRRLATVRLSRAARGRNGGGSPHGPAARLGSGAAASQEQPMVPVLPESDAAVGRACGGPVPRRRLERIGAAVAPGGSRVRGSRTGPEDAGPVVARSTRPGGGGDPVSPHRPRNLRRHVCERGPIAEPRPDGRQGSWSLALASVDSFSGPVNWCPQHCPSVFCTCTSTGCVRGSGSSRFAPFPLNSIFAASVPVWSLTPVTPPAEPVFSAYLKPD